MTVMKVEISKNKIHDFFFDIELTIEAQSEVIELQLPAWRPGRYELQNFSKNIPIIKAYNLKQELILCEKIARELWQIKANKEIIKVKYSYFANKMDAGNSFVNDEIFYLNFVNCIPHIKGKLDWPIEISLNIPKDWSIASALDFGLVNGKYWANVKNYFELYDSPTIAAPTIKQASYQVEATEFKIQIIGKYDPNWDKIVPAFEAFTSCQLAHMGDFPFTKYQFIVWVLPIAFYHGVEHGSSTMITLGPDYEADNLINDLLGVSSHELFHAWNICKIRPKALLPYDYKKENYFDTGFVVEGVTTYLGDLFLVQSAVISKQDYLKELSTLCMRHFLKDSFAQQSLTEASFDLWVDGYEAGIPNKKVSIYNKGALVALMLDLMIRDKFSHQKNLLTIMKLLWDKFGKLKIGYTFADYRQIAEQVFGESLNNYFEKYISGTEPLEVTLSQELAKFGLTMVWINENSISIEELPNQNLAQKVNLEKYLNIYNSKNS
jgi:predicted metalloprotease with PDZ domain